ncbi:MAG: alanine racemase [Oscillospiraceae bacterium]|jgi:alanine racemase|nr:alanine racemase [Oscillospiraceae bacterium]
MKNLVIDTAAVRQNLRTVRDKTDGAMIIADLSANAQGMGLVPIAKLLRDEGVKTFAVSDPRDAEALRRNGFTEEQLMMLRSTSDPKELAELLELGVVCTAGSYDAAVAINGIAESRGAPVDVQIEVDTGLGRYGFRPEETDRIAAIYRYMSSLNVVGTFTTLAASHLGQRQTLQQIDTFNAVLDKLTEMGLEPGFAHCCDSVALFRFPFAHMDAVRIDTALSGRMAGKAVQGLTKVGYIEAGIEEVGWVPKGHRFGAERPLTTTAPTKIAVLSVGYFHGFSVDRLRDPGSLGAWLRHRNKRLYVRLNGQRARVLGAVGLEHTLIDVTRLNCTVGDVCALDVDPVNVKGLPVTYR